MARQAMTKKDLRTGMFGVDSLGNYFVIAGELIVYQSGVFDYVKYLSEDLCFRCGRKIEKLFSCKCFIEAEQGQDCIYDRKKEETENLDSLIEQLNKALKSGKIMFVKEND